MSLYLVNFLFNRNNYEFRNDYDVFTFMFEGLVPVVFVLLAVLVYTGFFSQEIQNRFIVYTRLRLPLKKLLLIKFSTNLLLTFRVSNFFGRKVKATSNNDNRVSFLILSSDKSQSVLHLCTVLGVSKINFSVLINQLIRGRHLFR